MQILGDNLSAGLEGTERQRHCFELVCRESVQELPHRRASKRGEHDPRSHGAGRCRRRTLRTRRGKPAAFRIQPIHRRSHRCLSGSHRYVEHPPLGCGYSTDRKLHLKVACTQIDARPVLAAMGVGCAGDGCGGCLGLKDLGYLLRGMKWGCIGTSSGEGMHRYAIFCRRRRHSDRYFAEWRVPRGSSTRTRADALGGHATHAAYAC